MAVAPLLQVDGLVRRFGARVAVDGGVLVAFAAVFLTIATTLLRRT